MSVKSVMVNVKCTLCGSDDYKPVYVRSLQSNLNTGQIKIRNVMCKKCGLMYMNPRPTPESIAHYYLDETLASGSTYHSIEVDSKHDLLNKKRADFVKKNLKGKKTGLLLDVGCSTGDFLMNLKLPEWQLFGLEASPYAVKIARSRKINILFENIDTTNLEANKFDVICSISSLEHFFDPALTLSKMVNGLKKNGHIMIEVPDSRKPVAQIAEFYGNEHLTHFTPATLTKLLANYGVKVCSIYYNYYENVHNFIVWGEKTSDSKIDIVVDDRKELLAALKEYKKERKELEKMFVKRFTPLIKKWKKNSSRVAIYGAGVHTLFLFEIINLKECIACFIDSDPKKKKTTFVDWKVYGPESIDKLKLDAIIISSKSYEDEIFHAISHYQDKGIDVIKCYS